MQKCRNIAAWASHLRGCPAAVGQPQEPGTDCLQQALAAGAAAAGAPAPAAAAAAECPHPPAAVRAEVPAFSAAAGPSGEGTHLQGSNSSGLRAVVGM